MTEKIPTYCAQCWAVCAVYALKENGKFVAVKPIKRLPGDGSICAKGIAGPEIVYSPQRVLYPLKRTKPKGNPDPGFVKISWEEALDTVSQKVAAIRDKYGPEAIYIHRPSKYGSASIDQEGWLRAFANGLETPNTLGATHICNWHREVATSFTLGTGLPYPDFEKSACIMLWGTNPPRTNPRIHAFVKNAKKHGAKIVVIDPRQTEITRLADKWVALRPGSDGALALGLIDVLISERLFDLAFIKEWTNGPFLVRNDNNKLLVEADIKTSGSGERYVAWDDRSNAPTSYDPKTTAYENGDCGGLRIFGECNLKLTDGRTIKCRPAFQILAESAAQWRPEKAYEVTGLRPDDVRELARLLGSVKPVSFWTFNGIERRPDATQTNRAISTLNAITGNLGTPGGNSLSWTTTLTATTINPRNVLPAEQLKKRLGINGPYSRPLGPPGMVAGSVQADALYDAILHANPYPVKAGLVFGGNSLLTQGDSEVGYKALLKLDFLAVAEIFMTPVAELADIVFPSATCWESEFVRTSFGWSEPYSSYAMMRKKIIEPQGESRPDTWIMAELANRLGFGERFFDGKMEVVFDNILSPLGLSAEKLREKPFGIHYGPADAKYYSYRAVDKNLGRVKGFETPSGKVEIYSLKLARKGYPSIPQFSEKTMGPASDPELRKTYPYFLTTSKVGPYNHSSYRGIPSLRKKVPEPYAEINPKTAKAHGIKNGDWVKLGNWNGTIRVKAKVTNRVPPLLICTQYGWYEECKELNLPGYDILSNKGANLNLIQKFEYPDQISGSIALNASLCNIERADG
ncbi:MAG: molybdopterin-dependent oxidoreductase [Candidatus Binatia bacterium]